MKKSLKNPFSQKVGILFIASSFIVLISLTGCSTDDGINSNSCENWSEQFFAQAEAYLAAESIYSNDPTLSNCNNVKAKGLNYVEAIEGILNCVPAASLSVYNDDLRDLKAEINNTPCDN